MRVALKASPDPQRLFPAAAEAPPPALLAPTGPDVVLGDRSSPDGLPLPVAPSADSLFGPRGACLAAEDGPLWVADSGHHRLLGWRGLPRADNAPADWVIGQPDFAHLDSELFQRGAMFREVSLYGENAYRRQFLPASDRKPL